MKVYVDEKDNGITVTYKEENGKRQYLYVHDKEGFIFKSLADYTKQVRKEVCDEIKDLAGNYFELPYCDNCGETLFASSDVVLTGSDLTEILDQIQGE